MDNQLIELKRKASYAGLLYLALIILGFYMTAYVYPNIQVVGDPQATFDNLLENEFLFRTGIFAHLLNTVVFTMLVLALYRLLGSGHKYVGMLMVAFVVLHLSFEFGAEALNLAALMVAKGNFLGSMELLQRQEWAYLFLRTARYSMMVLSMAFWGLWLITLGTLVYRSVYIPRIFGVLLFLGGTAYFIQSTMNILFPGTINAILSVFIVFYAVGPIAFMLWLLIKGISTPKPEQLK